MNIFLFRSLRNPQRLIILLVFFRCPQRFRPSHAVTRLASPSRPGSRSLQAHPLLSPGLAILLGPPNPRSWIFPTKEVMLRETPRLALQRHHPPPMPNASFSLRPYHSTMGLGRGPAPTAGPSFHLPPCIVGGVLRGSRFLGFFRQNPVSCSRDVRRLVHRRRSKYVPASSSKKCFSFESEALGWSTLSLSPIMTRDLRTSWSLAELPASSFCPRFPFF